ncbi:hypothetical protein CHISP_0858 [Chitinispirillum alkaliphilum]|nr:hypothetical protein CHISP_0858 [Chitinispirillum alkaliphilum]
MKNKAVSNVIKTCMNVYKTGGAKWILRIIITLLFVWFVNGSLTSDDIRILSENISLRYLGLSFLFGLIATFLQVLRWRIVLSAMKFQVSFTDVVRSFLKGCFLGFMTPGRSGELFRGFDLDPSLKIRSVKATVLDRAYAVIVVLIVGMSAAVAQKVYTGLEPLAIFILPVLVIMSVVLTGLCFFRYWSRFLRLPGFVKLSQETVFQFFRDVFALMKQPRFLVLTLMSHLFLLLQTSILFYMLGFTDFMWNLLTAAQSYAFMIFLPIFVANAGIREFSFATFMAQRDWGMVAVGIDAAAVGVSAAVLICNIILPALAGLIWIYLDTKKQCKSPQQHKLNVECMQRENEHELQR